MTIARKLQQSNVDMYHVFIRGMGRQLLFEDDADRERFLRIVARALSKRDAELLAWVLMSNHAHFLVHASCAELSALMKGVQGSYAYYFNRRYDRVGSLFQGRFGSQPIHDDAQLLAAVRYIHANPLQAGIADGYQYPWSSYNEYMMRTGAEAPWRLCNTELVHGLCQGRDGFEKLHRCKLEDSGFLDEDAPRGRTVPLQDEVAWAIANEELGMSWRFTLCDLPRKERNRQLAQLRMAGLSIRQIERLTGLGRGIIARACSS